MPDSRHVVLGLERLGETSEQLWIADTDSGEYHALTSGTTVRWALAVSPDGQRIIFGEDTGSYDIVSVDLATATAHALISTERDELMPSWAAHKPLLAFVTDRNGPQEIWLHSLDNGGGNADRPLVTAHDFPGVPVQWFMGAGAFPRGRPRGLCKIDSGTEVRLWISAVAGGPPVPLTNDRAAGEFPGLLVARWKLVRLYSDRRAAS